MYACTTYIHNLLYNFSASPDLSLDDEISDTIDEGETKYLNYPFDDDGITVQLEVTSGTAILYASTVVQTPNEALHDVMLETNGWEDAYIDPDHLTNPDSAATVYIAIESKDSASDIQLSVETGDSSTGIFMIKPHHVSSVYSYPSVLVYTIIIIVTNSKGAGSK